MKSKKTLLRPVALTPPPLPVTTSLPPLAEAPKERSRPEKAARGEKDPGHRFHDPARPSDSRPGVAATGAMSRVRANMPEFHKKGAASNVPVAGVPARRKIHGGLVAKRRAGK